MKIFRLFLFLLCTLTLLPAPSYGQSVTEQVKRHYANMTSLEADFTQELQHKESGNTENRTGIFLFKKPLLVHWKTNTPTPELLVISDKEIWNVFPDEHLAYKYPLDVIDNSGNIIKVITGQTPIDETFSVEGETREGQLIKLHLFPHEPVQSLTEAFLWVEESGLITKVKLFDFFGNVNTIEFTKHRIGKQFDKGAFAFTPPKNYEVEVKGKDGVDNTLLK